MALPSLPPTTLLPAYVPWSIHFGEIFAYIKVWTVPGDSVKPDKYADIARYGLNQPMDQLSENMKLQIWKCIFVCSTFSSMYLIPVDTQFLFYITQF